MEKVNDNELFAACRNAAQLEGQGNTISSSNEMEPTVYCLALQIEIHSDNNVITKKLNIFT